MLQCVVMHLRYLQHQFLLHQFLQLLLILLQVLLYYYCINLNSNNTNSIIDGSGNEISNMISIMTNASIWPLVGGASGGGLLIIIIVILFVVCRARSKRRERVATMSSAAAYSPSSNNNNNQPNYFGNEPHVPLKSQPSFQGSPLLSSTQPFVAQPTMSSYTPPALTTTPSFSAYNANAVPPPFAPPRTLTASTVLPPPPITTSFYPPPPPAPATGFAFAAVTQQSSYPQPTDTPSYTSNNAEQQYPGYSRSFVCPICGPSKSYFYQQDLDTHSQLRHPNNQ